MIFSIRRDLERACFRDTTIPSNPIFDKCLPLKAEDPWIRLIPEAHRLGLKRRIRAGKWREIITRLKSRRTVKLDYNEEVSCLHKRLKSFCRLGHLHGLEWTGDRRWIIIRSGRARHAGDEEGVFMNWARSTLWCGLFDFPQTRRAFVSWFLPIYSTHIHMWLYYMVNASNELPLMKCREPLFTASWPALTAVHYLPIQNLLRNQA